VLELNADQMFFLPGLRKVRYAGSTVVVDRWPGADGWLSLTGIAGE